MKTAILFISEAGQPVAQTLGKELTGSEIYTTTTPAEGCIRIDSIATFMGEAFDRFDAFVFIGAMGICVRAIAPHIRDKHTDPAVVCVDTTGRYAIAVLSGHVGGANELTKHVAGVLGAEAIVTTQSDRTGLWALDTLADEYDWSTVPAGGCTLNEAISLFVGKAPTALLLQSRDRGTEYLERTCPPHVHIYYRTEEIDRAKYRLMLCVTPYTEGTTELPTLRFVPKVMHVGVGLAHLAAPHDEVIANLWQTLTNCGISPLAIKSMATIEEKRTEPVVQKLAETYPFSFYRAEELSRVDVPTPSDVVSKHMGTPSVSEAAALLASGGGALVVTKQKGQNYTLAVAVDAAAMRGGHIEIVGAGPGDPDLISVRGRQMLEAADLILYAGSLVPRELTLCAKAGATVRSSASLDLEEQFHLMKQFYDRGQFVVRLHTGDPCIYGAIQEQMNFFDRHAMSYHITPGISSFQAAAAALQSQFTIPERVQTIILTRGEGRTPMPEKEKLSLLARSQSTMCIFLSAGVVEDVQSQLLEHYPPTTPVAACYHLTWKDERIYRGELKDLARMVKENHLTLTTMLVIGDAIDNREGLSRLYAREFNHLFRTSSPDEKGGDKR